MQIDYQIVDSEIYPEYKNIKNDGPSVLQAYGKIIIKLEFQPTTLSEVIVECKGITSIYADMQKTDSMFYQIEIYKGQTIERLRKFIRKIQREEKFCAIEFVAKAGVFNVRDGIVEESAVIIKRVRLTKQDQPVFRINHVNLKIPEPRTKMGRSPVRKGPIIPKRHETAADYFQIEKKEYRVAVNRRPDQPDKGQSKLTHFIERKATVEEDDLKKAIRLSKQSYVQNQTDADLKKAVQESKKIEKKIEPAYERRPVQPVRNGSQKLSTAEILLSRISKVWAQQQKGLQIRNNVAEPSRLSSLVQSISK